MPVRRGHANVKKLGSSRYGLLAEMHHTRRLGCESFVRKWSAATAILYSEAGLGLMKMSPTIHLIVMSGEASQIP